MGAFVKSVFCWVNGTLRAITRIEKHRRVNFDYVARTALNAVTGGFLKISCFILFRLFHVRQYPSQLLKTSRLEQSSLLWR
jgi:hypothetical protein